jgi:hypothetical protein
MPACAHCGGALRFSGTFLATRLPELSPIFHVESYDRLPHALEVNSAAMRYSILAHYSCPCSFVLPPVVFGVTRSCDR